MLYEQIGIRNVSNLLIATPIIKTLGVTTFLSYSFNLYVIPL